jgi:hypothetical protein
MRDFRAAVCFCLVSFGFAGKPYGIAATSQCVGSGHSEQNSFRRKGKLISVPLSEEQAGY